MSVTCQQIIARAVGFSTANQTLADNTSEMLSRIQAEQRQLYVELLKADPDYLASVVTLTVASGSTTLPAGVTLLTLALPSGTIVSRVDRRNVGGELAPRYVLNGRTVVEAVPGEWGGAGTLTATVARAPANIDPTGATSQVVDVPDEWVDVLVTPLAKYLCAKDLGRPAQELADLGEMVTARKSAYLQWVQAQGGTVVRSLDARGPSDTDAGE